MSGAAWPIAQASAADGGAGGDWRSGAVMSAAGSLCAAGGAVVATSGAAGAGAGGNAVVGCLFGRLPSRQPAQSPPTRAKLLS
ncbi:hypothetical protein ACFFW8_27050 [Erwinia tracheiphila]